jgi:hypothetical protein
MSRVEKLSAAGTRRGVLAFLPFIVAAALAIVLVWGLTRDPGNLPSMLIGKPVPDFDPSPVQGRLLGLSSADPKGEVSLAESLRQQAAGWDMREAGQ